MKYYVAFDGGGSKLNAILFDENLNFISRARSGSMNTSSSPQELIEENARSCAEELLRGTGVTEIECVYGVFSPIVANGLKSQIKVNRLDDRGGEGMLGLLAAFVYGDAVIALSGTGSVVFYSQQEGPGAEAGGYGSVVNDEGSGYHMGRLAFAAAIRDYEQRGEHTLITECICRHFGVESLPQATSKVYEMPKMSPIAAVASAAICVGEAARKGDKIAINLLKEIGENMADQAMGLINRFNVPKNVPIVLTGGHFKNDRRISEAFIEYVKERQPEREVILPYFEPIVGAVLAHPYLNGKTLSDNEIERVKESYKDFRYVFNTF